MNTMPEANVAQILAALEILTEPEQVMELRVIGVDGRATRTDSGYFDDTDELAKAAGRYDRRATAVYVTLHPVLPALLSRASNRVQEWAKTTTNDRETTCRRWLLIDTDATRPAGISSTDDEHEAALARARTIRDWLCERGWPEPIYADSGNGGHLLYRVDLPVDDGGLTQRILVTLAALFDDRLVTVDRTVYNPSRISKLYGTLARKGDSTPDRPHRRACILEAPDTVSVVPMELLEALAPNTPAQSNTIGAGRAGRVGGFDVEAYLRAHGITFSGPVPYDGGKKWLLDACVWNGHTDKAAIVIQRTDGSLGANCSHNSCEGKGWQDLRDAVEPGWREEREARERVYQERTGTVPEASGGESKKPGKRPPQRNDLIALADDADLFHTPQGVPYATIAIGSHRETWRLTSRGFREWLAHRYYREHGGSANTQALQDAITALAGRARYDGPERPVHIRLAEGDGTIYLDLCDASWRVVAIDATGWRIVGAGDVPVRFRRTKGMLALPTPSDGGTLATLRSFVNLTDADWILFVAALIAALNPRGPYPILGIFGEKGSAKSTLARIARSLIDPNISPLRTLPRDERDLMIAAMNGWHLAFDNVSVLSAWISDALCRLATGGGLSTRELFSDDDETIFDAQRAVILNGITDFVTQSDLLDRLIPLNLLRIPDDLRKAEAALWLSFEQARPAIIGTLLTAVSTALRNRPTIHLTSLPRMADFALWVAAATPALGFTVDEFLQAYKGNRAGANEVAIEASPLAGALISYAMSQGVGSGNWQGRASELLGMLATHVDEATRKQRGWPADAARLSGELKRIAPNLRAVGLSVEWPKARTIRMEWRCIPDKEDNSKTALSPLSAPRDADKANDTSGNGQNGNPNADGAHNGDCVLDADTASSHKVSAGKRNNADNADNAAMRTHSPRMFAASDFARVADDA